MIRDLDDKGLGQNKVLYSSSGVKLPRRLPNTLYARETDLWLPAGFWLFRTTLTQIPPCRLFLVASSLSLFPCRLFLGTLFDASIAPWCAS